MPIWLSLILVVFFLFMNAFFVVAEFACVRVRKSQIDLAVEAGKPGAQAALIVSENINAYLSACQLGITLASLALGWLGEPAVSELFRPLFNLMHMPEAAVGPVSVAIGFTLITTLHVVAGELIPKSLAILSTESYALMTARPLRWFYRLTFPVMVLFNAITNGVMKLLGHGEASEREVYTGEEIKLLIDESTEEGLISSTQNEFVDNIFDLGEKDAEALMTPRIDMVCMDLEDSLEENLRLVPQYKYTRYPVCRGSKDRIVGFVHVKDLYALQQEGQVDELPIREIEAVPESITVSGLMSVMQEKHTEIAIVVDEHGGTAGMITLSDIMEQIVGRFDDEYRHDSGQDIIKLEDDLYLLDGSTPMDDVVELIGFRPEEAEECETAGGLLLSLFDRIPDEGDRIYTQNATTRANFIVVDMDRHRIDKIEVHIEHLQPDESDED